MVYNLEKESDSWIVDDKQRDSFAVPQISISQSNGKLSATEDDIPERGTWTKSIQSLLLCISMSVGLGNVWRFPNVAYNNGGGAFLIPYLILLVIIGRPLYYMEMILGQFSSQGPIKVWKCVPAFKDELDYYLRGLRWAWKGRRHSYGKLSRCPVCRRGESHNPCTLNDMLDGSYRRFPFAVKRIGYAQLISVSYVVIFYNYLMALSLFYLFASMQSSLPWSCPSPTSSGNGTNGTLFSESNKSEGISCEENYWRNEVLQKSKGLDEVTIISWKLVLCLMLTWILVYISVMQGVDSLGKMAYVTAFLPYVVLTALLIISLLQDGAINGIKFFFIPDNFEWKILLNVEVWYNACEQSFFSLAVGYGNIVMIASYNKFTNNIYRDAIIISVVDTFTNILAGCVVFAVLGSLAHNSDQPISEVAKSEGMGLAFVAYPAALANIPYVPQLWSALFFVMLFTLGIGSSMSQIETVLTIIKDRFPALRQKKWLLSLGICVFFFLFGLPLTTDAGQYILIIIDKFGVGTTVFLYATFEVIGIMWIYGIRNFCQDVAFMLKKPVGIFWKITWFFTAPVALVVIFIYGNIISSSKPSVEGIPWWGSVLGWFLAGIALIQIPIWFFLTVYRCPQIGLRNKILTVFKSTPEWGPRDGATRAEWKSMRNPAPSEPKSAYIVGRPSAVYENDAYREDVF